MADYFDRITDKQADLIRQAPLFFVATADPGLEPGANVGAVNVSPKGGVPLHVLDEHRIAYLDYTGSGNETARHSMAGGPITVMVCSFDREDAAVVRLYGHATVTPLAESPLAEQLLAAPAEEIALPERQAIVVDVESTATSCGYGVPVMTFGAQRTVRERGRRYKVPRKA
ncbi:MAG: pyridoxamine 5'-phosphate oxidase family protein [Chloroflexota bacterium]|nr:pyridoxamine 5'-phosphate oxidase family protein [Chloroflexota bacterium]MDE2883588.1 pyridoxamine 5'-phosphate oxidase family protein [Chloroflexota bacterium]